MFFNLPQLCWKHRNRRGHQALLLQSRHQEHPGKRTISSPRVLGVSLYIRLPQEADATFGLNVNILSERQHEKEDHEKIINMY